MNVKTTKIPSPRLPERYDNRFDIKTYGDDNLYPHNLQRIVAASGTATLCLDRYAKFIEGYGFAGVLATLKMNDGQTADDILSRVAKDVAEFGGFSLHVNYNLLGQITDVHHIPFEHCRLEECDDRGHVAHIKVSSNWDGTKKRKGLSSSLSEKDIRTFPVYNPDPRVVLSQIAAVGGIDNYDGQVLWQSADGETTYPTPIYDAAVTEISTDEGLGNVKYRSVRSNFLVSCMLITKKGIPYAGEEREHASQRGMISEDDLRLFQGDENTSKIMLVELEDDEDEPRIVQFPVKDFSKEFEVTENSVVERIYAQFHQELFYAIRQGKLGFSGQTMREAFEYYAGEVTTEQRFIERAFAEILAHWFEGFNEEVGIMPMRYVNSEEQSV